MCIACRIRQRKWRPICITHNYRNKVYEWKIQNNEGAEVTAHYLYKEKKKGNHNYLNQEKIHQTQKKCALCPELVQNKFEAANINENKM
jgi:hypothetical protein